MADFIDPLVGRLVAGRFEVSRRLGQGGMGAVYVARQRGLERDVALKVIRGEFVGSEQDELAARFEREARAIARLSHKNIVVVHDFGVDVDGTCFLALELLAGTTLTERMARAPAGQLPLRTALAIARDLASALVHAHQAGVLHRDLKPDNIMLVGDDDETAKVLDFGIAKLRDGDRHAPGAPPMTTTKLVLGTPGYVAPEVIMRGMIDDPRTDLYALGVILFEMLAGTSPFDAVAPGARLVAQATLEAPVLASRVGVPAEVSALVQALLARDPAQRPADARAVVAQIDVITGRAAATPAPTTASRTMSLSALAGGVTTREGTAAAPSTPPASAQSAQSAPLASASPAQSTSSSMASTTTPLASPAQSTSSSMASTSTSSLLQAAPTATPPVAPAAPREHPSRGLVAGLVFAVAAAAGAAGFQLNARPLSTTTTAAALSSLPTTTGVFPQSPAATGVAPPTPATTSTSSLAVAPTPTSLALSTAMAPATTTTTEATAPSTTTTSSASPMMAAATPTIVDASTASTAKSTASTPTASTASTSKPIASKTTATTATSKPTTSTTSKTTATAVTSKPTATTTTTATAAAPTMTATAPKGALTSARVKESIQANLGPASRCTNTNIKPAPTGSGLWVDHCPSYKTLGGDHIVVFTVAPDGVVDDVRFGDGADSATRIGGCVLETLRGWRFPPFDGDSSVEITQRVVFDPCVPINGKCVF